MTITINILQSIFKSTKSSVLEGFVDPLNKVCEKYEINTPMRKAAFLAQIGHESGGLTVWAENSNYSADRLLQVFPRYFATRAIAAEYERKPEKIASRVYANRMGNSNEFTGDGYTYRGRGLIQLTGKTNYQSFANAIGMTLAEVADYMGTLEGAAMSAGWFWDTRKLNALADKGDTVNITRAINGGINGLNERMALFAVCQKVLANEVDIPAPASSTKAAPTAEDPVAPVVEEKSVFDTISSLVSSDPTPSTPDSTNSAPAAPSDDSAPQTTISSLLNAVESVVIPSKKKTTKKK